MKRSQAGFSVIAAIAVLGIIILLVVLVGLIGSHNKTSTNSTTASGGATMAKCFSEVQGPAARQTTDQKDDSSGYQVHVIYAVPSGADRHMDTNGQIATSVSAWENWLCNRAEGQYLRLDTYKGKLDVSYASVSSDLAFDDLGSSLRNLGFNNPHKLYQVYYESKSEVSCGRGGSLYAVRYVRGEAANVVGLHCNNTADATNFLAPQEGDLLMLHESLHAIGFIPSCAPHSTDGYHISVNPSDLMYQTGEVAGAPHLNPYGPGTVLDPNHTDYYKANISGCLDLSQSIFMVGGGNQLPAGLTNVY